MPIKVIKAALAPQPSPMHNAAMPGIEEDHDRSPTAGRARIMTATSATLSGTEVRTRLTASAVIAAIPAIATRSRPCTRAMPPMM